MITVHVRTPFLFETQRVARAWATAGAGATAARLKLFNDTFVDPMIEAGVWGNSAAMWLLASHAAGAANVNLANPGTGNLTALNSPTFTADEGYTGDSPNSAHLIVGTLNWDTLTGVSQDDISASVRVMNNLAQSSAVIGGVSSGVVFLEPRRSTDLFGTRLNDATTHTSVNTDSAGMFCMSRSDGATYEKYINGVALTPASRASTAPATGVISLLRRATVYSDHQIGYARVGPALTADEAADESTIFDNWLAAI